MDDKEFANAFRMATNVDHQESADQPVRPIVPVEPHKLLGEPDAENEAYTAVDRTKTTVRKATEDMDRAMKRDFRSFSHQLEGSLRITTRLVSL